MATMDINNIKINRIVNGITCPDCGGNLKKLTLNNVTGKIIKVVTFGKKNIHNYKCEKCNRSFNLI